MVRFEEIIVLNLEFFDDQVEDIILSERQRPGALHERRRRQL